MEDWITACWSLEQAFCSEMADEMAAHVEDDLRGGAFCWREHVMELPIMIGIPMEDEIIHTDEHPYCEDPDCPCWQEWTEREAAAERRYIEAGMTESYDALPWRYGDDW
jgi:hypothetical protein